MTSRDMYSDNQEIIFDDSTQELSADGCVVIRNPFLASLSSDMLYHLALSTDTHDLPALFGDVRFVCVGGTGTRMRSFAQFMAKELKIEFKDEDLTSASHRFSMWKVGPVLSVTHGMGTSSLSICLHELIKLVYYARCRNVVFVRIGTSGGIGVAQGTVVISDRAVDGLLRPFYELYILGKVVRRPALFDKHLVDELKAIGREITDFPTVSGTTLCAQDFYECETRMDGAFCAITADEKTRHLNELSAAGVVNIEMEAVTFASMCHYAGIKGAIVCVALLDRLKGDQISSTKQFLEEMQSRPQVLVAKFIKKRLTQKI